jgi:uncharacterized protein
MTSAGGSSMTPRRAQTVYLVLLGAVLVLVTVTLFLSKAFFGWYPRPPWFGLFQLLDSLQLGFLIVAAAALAVQLGRRLRFAALRAALVLPTMVVAVWLALWAVVHARFGIRLSLMETWEVLTAPQSIQLVGLLRSQLLGTCTTLFLGTVVLATAIQATAARSNPGFTRRTLWLALGGFLALHVVVRSYFAYHLARNQRAVLMLDEGAPLALRTEELIPGLTRHRVALPRREDKAGTAAYLAWAAAGPAAELPRKPNLLWISVESLRFDALTDSTAPYLFGHCAEFQLRLGGDHWSGGNATKPGTFSMLTGLAAVHLQPVRRAGLAFPLLQLLTRNGYRLRIAKGLSFYYGDLRAFLPRQAEVAKVSAPSLPASDRAMVDSLLLDLDRRDPARPSFDLLTFDATHWPYDDPDRYRSSGPAQRAEPVYRALRSPDAVREARMRYHNSVRFIDAQIGRLLERMEAKGMLERTVVIVTGDHGEEFLERGQLAHSSGINDFQDRIPLWMRFPTVVSPPEQQGLTSNLDIVPTLLDYLGVESDILRTQGRSLLRPGAGRPLLMVAEHGSPEPAYHVLVSATYISRWRADGPRYLFSSVERRDGAPVVGLDWWHEVEAGRPAALEQYEVFPDVREAPRRFVESRDPPYP